MPKIITPTIGRRVWYWPSDDELNDPDGIATGSANQACDAGVVFVHSDRLVNLAVTDHEASPHKRIAVRLLQEGDERPALGSEAFAEWMPYQAAQAKKQETETQRDASA